MKRLSQQEVIERFREIHSDKYDYSQVEYIGNREKVLIKCPEHGEFWQSPKLHLLGSGCPDCGKLSVSDKNSKSQSQIIQEFIKVHGDKYDYSKVEYVGAHDKVCIICSKHGEFWQAPNEHKKGKGCERCSYELRGQAKSTPFKDFLSKAKQIHGDRYDYSKASYINGKVKIAIVCPEHGEFLQYPSMHNIGHGCPRCANNILLTKGQAIDRFRGVHGTTYDYSKVDYQGKDKKITIICNTHGEFEQTAGNHLSGQGCPMCFKSSSKAEKEVYSFIKSLSKDSIRNDRKILKGKEIDVYVPSKKLGIEYHGLYWHQEDKVGKDYHLDKLNKATEEGIGLIQIFEDEWLNKKDIVKSILRARLDKSRRNIYGRQTIVKEVPQSEAKAFLDANHLQGKLNSKINFGLYYKGELVSLMTFGDYRINMGRKTVEDEYEMLRFCNKLNTSIVGGASKLFKHFIDTYNPLKVISYSDKRYFDGNLYESLGFNKKNDTLPNYYYVVDGKRENRFKYRKSELIKMGFDSKLTERAITNSLGLYRIYDCGNYNFEWLKH